MTDETEKIPIKTKLIDSIDLEEIELKDIKGVGPVLVKKLQDAGIESVVEVAACTVQELADLIDCTKPTANNTILAAQELLRNNYYLESKQMTASELLEQRKNAPKLTTGSQELDTLLKGGIETGAITEFYGEFASGKSQVCFTLAVLATRPIEEKGLNGKVLYIDNENTFSEDRLLEICEARGFDPKETLDKIIREQSFSVSDYDLTMKNLGKTLRKHKIKLLIIDGLMSQYRAEFTGRGTLADRQQKINPMLNKLKKLIEVYNVACVVTNQVMSNPDQMFTGDPIKATGGHIVAHATTYRIYLRVVKKINRVATIKDSPKHAFGACLFTVTEAGVTDIKK